MTHGWPLFVTVCALAVLPYAYPQTGYWPVLGLLVLVALTPAIGNRKPPEYDGEDAQATKGSVI